jgi:hypothetical protein
MLTRPPGGMCGGRLARFLPLSAGAVERASVRVGEPAVETRQAMARPRFGGATDTSTAAFEVVATSGAPRRRSGGERQLALALRFMAAASLSGRPVFDGCANISYRRWTFLTESFSEPRSPMSNSPTVCARRSGPAGVMGATIPHSISVDRSPGGPRSVHGACRCRQGGR